MKIMSPTNYEVKGRFFFMFKNLMLLLLLFLTSSCSSDDEPVYKPEEPKYDGTLIIGNSTEQKVSALLTGFNTVYAHEDMRTWEDGHKLANIKKTGVSILRYPEGHQVSFWDWEFPYFPAYQNIWDPTYESNLTQGKKDQLKAENENRMLLDNYFQICRDDNIEPVVGINMLQGWKFDRNEESIEKAVRLVKYCMNQTPKVKYFFLDNEAGHQLAQNNHLPIDDYIELIPAYSQAIKAVYPEAKLITNIIDWNQIEKLIKKTGQYWDVLDIHWYYSTNNKWAYFNINDWREEIETDEVADLISDFNLWKQRYNMPHLKYSFLEWNAPPLNLTADSNPATLNYLLLGLIQSDMLMFMAKNNTHMAAAWPLMWQAPGTDVNLNAYNRNLLDRDDSSWLSPTSTIFEAFSHAQNGEVLENNYDGSSGLRILTVKRDQNKGYTILILNKSIESETIKIIFPEDINAVKEAKEFKGSTGQYGVQTTVISPELNTNETSINIEGSSFIYLLLQ